MAFKSILGMTFICFSMASIDAKAELYSRLGGMAFYDDQLNVTWLQDANYARTSGDDADGYMTWQEANSWAAGLSVNGITGWRLASIDVDGNGSITDCSSASQVECKDNEFGHLYYYGAGTAFGNGISEANPGPFSIPSFDYWSGTEVVTDTDFAWAFAFTFGGQYELYKKEGGVGVALGSAWAVHDGDIRAVPLPGAAWLFGSGFVGLLGIARRKKQ